MSAGQVISSTPQGAKNGTPEVALAAHRIASFIVEAVPTDHVRKTAAFAIADAFGCILSGARSEVALRVQGALATLGQGTVACYGAGRTLPADHAALCNAVAGHAYDLDDWEEPGNTGHFLSHGRTLERMEADYYYPAMADRRTPQEWAANHTDLLAAARERTRELLSAPRPQHIDPTIDRELRKHFPIRLPERPL